MAWPLLLLVLLAPLSAAAAEPDPTYEKLDVFAQVLQYLQNGYVEKVDGQRLVYGAIRGMLRSLDPHTSFMTPEEFKALQEDTSGNFGGVGVELEMKDGRLTVVAPLDGSPAAVAGIRAGDRVIRIDGAAVAEMDFGEASRRIKGTPGTKVVLTIDRDGFDEPRDFVLIRQRLHMNPVEMLLPLPGYAVIRIRSFQERTERFMMDAIAALKAQSGGQLKGLVLDLRNNPGGLLQQAVRVADRFLAEGLIVETRGRSARPEREFAHPKGTEPAYPMICLVNGGSASAAEIVAGALQDHGRALVLGTRTFGKGSVQTVLPLKDGSGLKMTIARYYTPKLRSIQEQGIIPDVEVPEEAPPQGDGHFTREEDLARHLKAETAPDPDRQRLERIADHQLKTALSYLKAWERFGALSRSAIPEREPAAQKLPKP
jgi:carboxyl-terminal processing protease